MSATLELDLDTSPPMPEFDTPVWVDDLLEVPYTIDEPEVVEAYFQDQVMEVTGNILRFVGEQSAGLVTVFTKDDVFNEGEWTLLVMALATYGRVVGSDYDEEVAAGYGRVATSSYQDDPDSTYDDGGGSTYAD